MLKYKSNDESTIFGVIAIYPDYTYVGYKKETIIMRPADIKIEDNSGNMIELNDLMELWAIHHPST